MQNNIVDSNASRLVSLIKKVSPSFSVIGNDLVVKTPTATANIRLFNTSVTSEYTARSR